MKEKVDMNLAMLIVYNTLGIGKEKCGQPQADRGIDRIPGPADKRMHRAAQRRRPDTFRH